MPHRIRVTIDPKNRLALGAVTSAIQQLAHDNAITYTWMLATEKPKRGHVQYMLTPTHGAKPEILRILREAAALGD